MLPPPCFAVRMCSQGDEENKLNLNHLANHDQVANLSQVCRLFPPFRSNTEEQAHKSRKIARLSETSYWTLKMDKFSAHFQGTVVL